ncbi:MAG: toll/interleukin-1 receptor domain-containing protein [Caldimonas sp.]
MTSRVFISYRSSDGADKATALARDLDALFGDEQIFLDKEDLAPGSRWRDAITEALGSAPILLVLLTPNYLGALDAQGGRCIDHDDDPARDELEAGIAARAQVIPLLCDGVNTLPSAAALPSPFDQLCELQWGRLRAYDWRSDMARLADELRALGLTPRPTSMTGTIPVPPHEPTTTPMPLDPLGEGSARHDGTANEGRRGTLVLVAVGMLALSGWGFWQWRQRRGTNLSGTWRTRIGLRGAPSSRDGELVLVTLEQKGRDLSFASSAVDIERNPEWQGYREAWKDRTGNDLNRVYYRGEGTLIGGDENETGAVPAGTGVAAPAAASAAEASAEAAPELAAASGPEAASDAASPPALVRKAASARVALPVAVRRVVIAVQIATPGNDGETVDQGTFRGIVDNDEQRIHGRLWLENAQSERVVDLRRGD